MKITVFTCNQTRHLHLIKCLSKIADEVFAVQECTTVFPGKVEDFYKKSETMQTYFSKVIEAEEKRFPVDVFLPSNVKQFAIRMGDLNQIPLETIKQALDSDVYIVFGGSYIKGELIDFLVSKKCINLHMGVSPFYRGAGTNFWPLFDKKPEYVGSTIHFISKGLDNGPILYHAMPKPSDYLPFDLGMQAVYAAHTAVCEKIKSNEIFEIEPVVQNRDLEVRYTKRAEFDDEIAKGFLENPPTGEFYLERLTNHTPEGLIRPIFI